MDDDWLTASISLLHYIIKLIKKTTNYKEEIIMRFNHGVCIMIEENGMNEQMGVLLEIITRLIVDNKC